MVAAPALTRFDELSAEGIPGQRIGWERIYIDASPDGTVWVTSAGRLFRITEPGLP